MKTKLDELIEKHGLAYSPDSPGRSTEQVLVDVVGTLSKLGVDLQMPPYDTKADEWSARAVTVAEDPW